MKRLGLLLLLALGGCSVVGSQGQLQLPTAAQLMDRCQAEIKAGTPSGKAPDCIAHFAIQQGCNVAALGEGLNPLIATVNPVAGSALQAANVITVTTCQAQGFIPVTAASL